MREADVGCPGHAGDRAAAPTLPVVQPRPITRLSEYAGEAQVVLAVTQLDGECSSSQARRVVAEWVEYLSAGPSPIQELRFVTRTPKRLFEALRGQPQLQTLRLKWGDYEDLSALEGMQQLRTLVLAGASSVRTLSPLASLQRVKTLSVDSLRHVHDLSPIGLMGGVSSLDLGGDWMTPRVAHVDSIAFLREMPKLRRLLLHTIIVDDLDYTPILAIPALQAVRVMAARGMRPEYEELKATLPWSENGNWPSAV